MLTIFDPASLLERPHGPLPRNRGQRRSLGENLNFANFNCWRHPANCTRREATSNSLANVVESLGFRPPLGDATGNSRALGNEHSGFVRFQRYEKLHTWILSGLWA